MTARERILAAIREGLGRGALDERSCAPLAAHLDDPRPNRLPAASRGGREALLRRFVAKVRRADATLEALPGIDRVPGAVAAQATGTHTVRVAPHAELEALDWRAAGLDARFGPATGDDAVGVARAHAGVAESGTLVLLSGPESPTTLNFLPDLHVVVLHADAVVGAYETVWAGLRDAHGAGSGFLPRTVNWITGPSRTADIEQTLHLGIHGPRRLHVLLVGADPDEASSAEA
ncbi:MAG: lactate utilization protein [Gammaproteobacteria bacterium]|nr:lactate utilization protein [Gammaproteobacteria bacterium]